MKLNYYLTEDYDELSPVTAAMIIKSIQAEPTGLFCFAGGDTPVKTLNIIADAAKKGNLDLSQAHFIELDEWVGLDPSNSGSCYSYLKTNLWDIAGVKKEQCHVFDGLAEDLVEECRKADAFIADNGGLTLALLGVGVNGHLGFNEPGTAFNQSSHVVELDESTQSVGQKYFTDASIDRTKGITLGIGQLLAAKELIVQASGRKKKEAVEKVLQGKIGSEWPVTAIWNHAKPVLVADVASVQ